VSTRSEGDIVVKKALCNMCPRYCGLNVHVRDGDVIKVEGNPRIPDTKGFICIKGRAAVDFHTHPGRINYPLKRVGKRGEDKWKRISWQQAMDEIAAKLKGVKGKHGPEAVAVIGGTVREPGDWSYWRWCSLFGTPNFISQGRNCGVSEFLSECATYGYHTGQGIRPGITKCAVLSGWNPAESHQQFYNNILEAQKGGMKLVVIDPRLTPIASRADLWLQLRPGTDGALGLAMLNVIINEELYDKEFVAEWCLGFDEIRQYIQEFTPQKAEEISWVPADKIIAAARLYATSKPAVLSRGVASTQLGPASKAAVQTRSILRAITGNLDVEGGNVMGRPCEKYAWLENIHFDQLAEHPERHRDNVSAEFFPIASVKGYRMFREAMKQVYPLGYSAAMYTLVPSPGYIWRAIAEEKPYPIKAIINQGGSPLLVFAQGKKFYEAYLSDKLELHVVMDLFMMPHAQIADYVLPAADWMERVHVKSFWGLQDYYTLGEQAVEPLYERRDDYQLWRELGTRLGQEEHWPETLEKMYDKFLEPAGVTFAELMARDEHWYFPPPKFKKYEEKGFSTFSGKVELTPSIFKKLGYDPLPRYEEPPRSSISTPEIAKEYPLVLASGSRVSSYTHSCYRQIDRLRRIHPDPLLEIHPQTATELGISDGDWVYIETPEGRVKQKAKLTEGIDPRVVNADGYWWYPERPGKVPQFFDTWESNINAIIPDSAEYCTYAGDNYFRGLLCKVYKA